MIKNILLKIRYDGTPFCGWQRQPQQLTVQGEVERVLSILCAAPVEINGTSRTDAGVHAYGQQASFSGDFAIPVENIKRAANNLLHPAIEIVQVDQVDPDFHARFNAVGKTYEYVIISSRRRDPFLRDRCYFVDRQLDVERMRQAAEYIEGTHDFRCFQAAGSQIRENTVRTVFSLNIEDSPWDGGYHEEPEGTDGRDFPGRRIVIRITGDGFLYNMVRIIAGTLTDVGLGRMSVADVKRVVESADRTKAGHTAPPQGLYLDRIYYDRKSLMEGK